MSFPLPLFIGLRYTRSKRRTGFIAFVSLFALLGMALGVFALVLVMSVMNGFDKELKERILRVVPHGFIEGGKQGVSDWRELSESVASVPGLVAVAPFIEMHGLLASASRNRGAQVYGVDPKHEPKVSDVHDFMQLGSFTALEGRPFGIIMGQYLASYLGVSVGDKVTLTLPEVSITPVGIFPRSKRFELVGIFEVGAQVDQNLAIIHLRDAQRLKRMGERVDGLRLRSEDIYQTPQIGTQISKRLSDSLSVKDWSQTQGSLFQAVQMERTVVAVMLSIVVAIAAFNIVTSLVMMVTEKRSDIAVLRTMGMSRGHVLSIFIVQGTSMGVAGILFGLIFGSLIAIFLPELMNVLERLFGLRVFDPEVYFVTTLPSVWRWQDAAHITVFSLCICILATIYPAYRASRIAPAEALRYDT